MERLRAGVIGVGAIAQIMHLPYLRELDDRFEIVALCDPDPVALEEVGRRYGVSRLFTSADELLAKPLDVVLILANVSVALLKEGSGGADPDTLTAYLFLIASSIHDVNALRGALGQPQDVLFAHHWAGGTSFTATLAYPRDVRATYTWTLLPQLKHYTEDFAFYASDGRVTIRFPSPYLRNAPTLVETERMDGEELQQTRLTTSYDEAFKQELLEFADCVGAGRTPRTDGPGFRQDLEMIVKIARAFPASMLSRGE